jgi:hypothetical protein
MGAGVGGWGVVGMRMHAWVGGGRDGGLDAESAWEPGWGLGSGGAAHGSAGGLGSNAHARAASLGPRQKRDMRQGRKVHTARRPVDRKAEEEAGPHPPSLGPRPVSCSVSYLRKHAFGLRVQVMHACTRVRVTPRM